MNKQELIAHHQRALKTAVSKNKRTVERRNEPGASNQESYASDQIIAWQEKTIQTHRDAIEFLEQLP